jgi:hypothetical protein
MPNFKVEFQLLNAHKMQRQTEARKGAGDSKTVGDVIRESRRPGHTASQKSGSKTVMDVIKASRKPNAAAEYADEIVKSWENQNPDSAALPTHALLGVAQRGGAINPVKLLEFEHQHAAQQVKPTKEDVARCGGGIGGLIRAQRERNP